LDVEILRQPITNIQKLLDWARQHQLLVVHTREGHRTDLTDLYSLKKQRTTGLKAEIGAEGPMGKLMLRGEYGHDLIDDLKPIAGEPVIDKPGYSAFAYTDLELILKNHDIKHLIISGVTTEVCVSSTFRQATDLGFYCITVEDACASANVDLHHAALQMITVENGIFGQVMCTEQVLKLVPEK
jgi:nicotinamidase-related amidase